MRVAKAVTAKIVQLLLVMLLVSLGTFFMLELIPGDPALALLGSEATAEQIAAVRAELGVDKPAVERYLSWLGNVFRGDLGESLVPPVQNVLDLIGPRLQVTVEVAVLALVLSIAIAVPGALLAANRPGGSIDRLVSATAFGVISLPSFLSGLLLISMFVFHQDALRLALLAGGAVASAALLRKAVDAGRKHAAGRVPVTAIVRQVGLALIPLAALAALAWKMPALPRQGFVRLTDGEGVGANLRSAFLPVLTLALIEGAVLMRVLRADLVTTLGEDYILAARAKGMPRWRILFYDALRPSSFSLLTVAGVAFGRLLGGTVIVETIFNLPGIGTMLVKGIRASNYTVVQAIVLLLASAYVLLNALVDLVYNLLDPRIRRGRA